MTQRMILTEQEQKDLRLAAWRTWQAIGADVEQAREFGPNRNRRISTTEMVEVVCDSDFMLAHGGLRGEMDKSLYQKFLAISRTARHRIVRDALRGTL